MSGTSTPKDLASRIAEQERINRERREKEHEADFESFRKTSKQHMSAVLDGMSAGMEEIRQAADSLVRDMRKVLRRRWLPALLTGFFLSTGIFGGSWGLMQYLSSRIQGQMVLVEENGRTISSQEAELRKQRQALNGNAALIRDQESAIRENLKRLGMQNFITMELQIGVSPQGRYYLTAPGSLHFERNRELTNDGRRVWLINKWVDR